MRVLLLLLVLLGIPLSASAVINPWTHSFYFENDLFVGTDSDYTNGMKYSIITPDLSPQAPRRKMAKIPRQLLKLFHQIPFIINAPPETGHKVEISFGQFMYTPQDISRFDLIKDDRPYAGYAYFATAYHRKSDTGTKLSLMDTVEVQFGLVGSLSLAEQAQKFVHQVRGLQRPNGWDNQLKDEPALSLIFERKWLFHPDHQHRFRIDAILHAGGAVGNVMTYANGGGELRAGWNIPRSFAVSLIRPAGSTWSTSGTGFSCYLFAAGNGRVVLRDIFLDGNSYRGSHHVDKKTLVADMSGGLTVRYKRLSCSLAYTRRTREFDLQPKHHGFGSLALSYAF